MARRPLGVISLVTSAWTSASGAQSAPPDHRSLTSVGLVAGHVSATGGATVVAGAELGADRQLARWLTWRGQAATLLAANEARLDFCREPRPCRRTTPKFSFMVMTGPEVGVRGSGRVTPLAGALVGLHRTSFQTTSFTFSGLREGGVPTETRVGVGAYAGVRDRRFRGTIGYTRLTPANGLVSLTLAVEWQNKAPAPDSAERQVARRPRPARRR